MSRSENIRTPTRDDSLVLSERDRNIFMAMLENEHEPNECLSKAIDRFRTSQNK